MPLFPLRPHQQVALDGIKRSVSAGKRRPVLLLPTGAGKCLGIGTPVLRYDGKIIAVEDVCSGDELMGPDSRPRRVISTTRGYGQMFVVSPVKGDSWICNDVHVLTLV